jgi:hypothetical protein
MKGTKTGGRQKGTPDKATREIKAATSAFLSSPTYVASAKKRILKGEAPHLEALWHHYAFGKPKETVAVESQVRVPLFALLPGDTPRVLPPAHDDLVSASVVCAGQGFPERNG